METPLKILVAFVALVGASASGADNFAVIAFRSGTPVCLPSGQSVGEDFYLEVFSDGNWRRVTTEFKPMPVSFDSESRDLLIPDVLKSFGAQDIALMCNEELCSADLPNGTYRISPTRTIRDVFTIAGGDVVEYRCDGFVCTRPTDGYRFFPEANRSSSQSPTSPRRVNQQPSLGTIVVFPTISKTILESYEVDVAPGVQKRFEREVSYVRALSVEWSAGGDLLAGAGVGPLEASLTGRISRSESRTIGHEVTEIVGITLDGNTCQKYQLNFERVERSGEVELIRSASRAKVPFSFVDRIWIDALNLCSP